MTPEILAQELTQCKRQDFRVFPMHLKHMFESTIKNELHDLGIFHRGGHVLESYECLAYDPKITIEFCKRETSNTLISKITSIGTALSSERNIEVLLEMILQYARQFSNADAGTLYLYNLTNAQLEFKVVQNDTMNIQMGGTHGSIQWPPLQLYDAQKNENRHMAAALCALDQVVINIPNVYESTDYDFEGTIDFDARTGYKTSSILVLPMKDHEENLIGVLQLINKQNSNGLIIPFDHSDEEIASSLASQAAVVLTKQKLINDLEILLESFLKTINVAIEEKSPYTAGHIHKMVDLSVMIAREISNDTGRFEHIHFDEDQLKEIKFAALMHDIGKITTPEYVIDKSTKLETIYDRINNIELRFEILKRDTYIHYLESKSSIDNPVLLQQMEENYTKSIKELDDEITFLKTANVGGEFFSDENIQKVHSIAQRTILLNGIVEPVLNEDEVKNLTVQKGTLTYDQRMIINNHAYVSLRMLQQLPFPRKLERVAEIACGHHEKISGGGYPLGLKGDELSFEARILAIADIFEALSASDRPYKKGKKLSEVMKILFFMAKDGDIDMDIIRFIYESGLYLRYAQATLSAEYIDEVVLNFDFEGPK
jgi:HD-GYP domain-containing protein (c-di-GMP phosphodiesterase class II)